MPTARRLPRAGATTAALCAAACVLAIHTAVAVAVATTDGAAATAPPVTQLHLALTPTQGDVVVTWAGGAPPAAANCSVVQYGTSATALGSTARGSIDSYTLVTYKSPTMHIVTLADLAPATRYYYRAGCDAAGGSWSNTTSFVTVPAMGAGAGLKVALFGDQGHTGNSTDTTAAMMRIMASEEPYQLLALAGDLSYANGWQPTWDSYVEMLEPLASTVPLMTTVGNHEFVELPVVGVLPNLQGYDVRFRMPRADGVSGVDPARDAARLAAIAEGAAPSSRPHDANAVDAGAAPTWSPEALTPEFATDLFYSVDVGPLHLIALNSEDRTFTPNSTQYQWLVADLAAANKNRAQVPWVVATMHRPFESSNRIHGNDTTMRDAWEPAMLDAKVDLIFNGHVHAYERTHPMASGSLAPAGSHGIVYLTVGNAGNGEGLYTKWVDPIPEYSAHHADVYGHVQFNIVNATHAHLQMLRNSDGGAEDDAWIVRST